jgi:RNA polymerase sigma factor (sigma-70 family)
MDLMAQGQLSLLMRNVRRYARAPSAGIADAQLLERFVGQSDEAAFELLLRRHERMVWNTCRRILPRHQDVEDAFQATFLALACKAGSIAKGQALASWLYKVAYRVAMRQRAASAIRQNHERRAVAEMCRVFEEPGARALDRELCDLLHEEVNRLPEKYRAAVVLCYLEGQTNEQAGVQLNCSTGTVSTRLNRARQRLRSRLARRGLTLPAAALAAALTEASAAAAVLPVLRNATVRGAVMFATDKTAAGVVSTQVAALTRGVLKAMWITKLKLTAAILLSIGVISAGSAALAFRNLLPGDRPLPSEPAVVLQQQRQAQPERGQTDQPRPTGRQTKKHTDDKSARAEETVSKSFKTGSAPRVIVELFNGGITVNAGADDGVQVRATKYGRAATAEDAKKALESVVVKMSQEGDTIRIQASRPKEQRSWHLSSGVLTELKVPAAATLELQTTNGAIALTGGSGKVHLRTSNGKVQIKDGKGQIDVRTSNGPITVSGATGRVELKTSNGRIDIHGDKAIVKAETSNGRVQFDGSLAGGKHYLHTSNGQIVLSLPPDASFRLHAKTSHGKIKSEFGSNKAGGKGRTRLDLDVGQNPSAAIELHTSNGNITIQQRQARQRREEED